MEYRYLTHGTCSQAITFTVDEEGKLHNVEFTGGCNGNLKGIAALVEGMPCSEARARLQGIRCGYKATSCPDQLAQALQEAGF